MKEGVNIAVNALMALYVTKGVQPSELIDNIFDDEYRTVSSKRNSDQTVTFTLSYIDQGAESIQTVESRYTYDADRILLLVEQKVGAGRYSTQWSRKEATARAIENLATALFEAGYSPERISSSLATLPVDLHHRVRTALKAVA
ncbi:hypothetical protein N5D61_02730 [Pseudomonas sp. GD03842]|uniref:hypothetical protein n=1 Tax=Pseudomonas sp. GD03842 TaxID=2975385 RepID=UPI00244729E2|nr:hypothetical protein [Pseudomonas sp. GD03842]MDH0745258.1 hypothetical protein [Pseudomonas sp. GD03842]